MVPADSADGGTPRSTAPAPPTPPDGGGVAAANGASKIVDGVAVTYAVTLVYLAITVFSISDRQLLVGDRLELPLFGVEVPLVPFFFYAPLLVVILHLLFLVSVLPLGDRIRRLPAGADLGGLLPTFHVQAFAREERRPVRRLYRLLLTLLLAVLPLVVLLSIQVTFLPFHDRLLTLFHQAALTLDLVMLWVLVPWMLSRDRGVRAWWRERLALRRMFTLGAGVALVVSWLVAVVPGTYLEWAEERRLSWLDRLPWNRDLVVSHAVLSPIEGAGCDPGDVACLCGRQPHRGWLHPGLDLRNRDLRNANLSRSVLIAADLRGADLTGARLNEAVLCHSDFSPGSSGAPTQMVGARLDGADLRSARLVEADLRRAVLHGADLSHAALPRADLRSAKLASVQLRKADLSHAHLDGAVLERAEARGADFHGALARGLRARRLAAEDADLRGADLTAASLPEAGLERLDFGAVRLRGADLRAALLRDARNLSLREVDLRSAQVPGATVLRCCDREPWLVDVRGLRPVLDSVSSAPPNESPVGPIGEALQCETALVDPPGCDAAAWAIDERRLHVELASPLALLAVACEGVPQAAALVTRAWGCRSPRQPLLEAALRDALSAEAAKEEACPPLREVLETARLPLAADPRPPAWWSPGRHVRSERAPPYHRCEEIGEALDELIAFGPAAQSGTGVGRPRGY